MSTRDYFSTSQQPYSGLWHKYRPALLKLMIASEAGAQEYKLYFHEFVAINQKQKDFTFTLHVSKGKAVNNIKTMVVAGDLLQTLLTSKRAVELMQENTFEISMNKKFLLQVKRLEPKTEAEPA